jgi:hypothetical protein
VVRIARVDFDGDGTADVFAFADASYFCGSAGCIPRLYRLGPAGADWQELAVEADDMINAEPENWSVLAADDSGWVRLELRTDALHLVFGWDGEAYVPVS